MAFEFWGNMGVRAHARPQIMQQVQAFSATVLPQRTGLIGMRETQRVAESSQTVSGVAERYASSLFELAIENNAEAEVSAALDSFQALLDSSEDLRRLIKSPVFGAGDQLKAITAILERAGISGLAGNFIKVAASNRRLFAVPGMIRSFREIYARHRGEVSADVTSAYALTATQEQELKEALKGVTGKDVAINVAVDPTILGGLIVKLGSRQIDTSLRTKLSTLKLSLKEVG
ncbi:MAG: synthase subunit delta [Rhizobium sp.]|nr:synthase subunit delta [Rhizobium sp.]